MNDFERLSTKCSAYFQILVTQPKDEHSPVKVLLNQYDKQHPNLSAFELKAAQYEILAENIEVVVFEESPFYFVNSITWCPGLIEGSDADWLYTRNVHIYKDADPETWRKFLTQQRLRLFLCCGSYADNVHFTVPIGNVVKYGMRKFYIEAEQAKKGASAEEMKFLNAAQRGLLAAKKICERYAETARRKLNELTEPKLRKNMEMLITAAEHTPWEAPRTFFEGLNTCWFCRNVLGAMEGIGNSTLGRVDYILNDLYENDIKDGRISKSEAYDLVKQFMVLGDMQYDKNTIVCGDHDHELEMGICIGGCDADGNPVYNDLTSMFIQAQREMHCIYPKIHARFGSNSPMKYLEELSQEFCSGRSTIGLSCDDEIIPALLHAGKTIEDARNYSTVGCWENKVDSRESMAGGNYIYLLTLLEQAVYSPEPEYVEAGVACTLLKEAKCFEDVYRILVDNAVKAIRWRCEAIGKYGKLAYLVNPLCLSSSMMDGCIQSKKDYTQGGCIYNLNTYDISGFANYADAMLAIKQLCYEKEIISLPDFLTAVQNNWQGHEELLYQVRHCSHFCDQSAESIALSQRLHNDLYHSVDGIENEHGGRFVMNYYVYREFFRMGKSMRATPDGRRDGEMFAQGIGPSKYHPPDALTSIVQSVSSLDREKVVAASLDFLLPFGSMTKEKLAMLLRVIAKVGVKHLQINCVSLEALKDAQIHPEKHQDLIVRVTGFSAKFVSLSPVFQKEILQRYAHEKQ